MTEEDERFIGLLTLPESVTALAAEGDTVSYSNLIFVAIPTT